jgi:hypothetical protein
MYFCHRLDGGATKASTLMSMRFTIAWSLIGMC